jgi:hypothetical protein
MRLAAFTLVMVSLALSAGGVRYTQAAETASAPSGAAPAESQQCAAAAAPRVREVALAPRSGDAPRAVALDTRGYNYRRPGESPSGPASPERAPRSSSR